jgi:NhaA family Na+:H+ antiporter
VKLTIGAGSFELSKSLLLWINDGLMAVFFFVVGLEIKREILVGELATPRKALLPIAAAVGGMAFPALIYLAFNAGQPGEVGWGMPMATDIAFALGVLALLGNRAPLSLKIFLTALAIVDDIGAVMVIALFYTAEITWASLAIAGVLLLASFLANRAGVRHPLVYALLGIGLWVAVLKSGLHATVAGVLLAMTIPPRSFIDADDFLAKSRSLLEEFERSGKIGASILTNKEQRAAVQALELACQQIESPLQRLEHALHPWVAYAIMPLFAFANAGVSLGKDLPQALSHPVAWGVIAGLVIGKQLGITLAVWILIKTNLATRPVGVTWRQIYGAGWLAGIGFTMSLFVGSLAFGDNGLLSIAKIGILAASLISGIVGWAILRSAPLQNRTG